MAHKATTERVSASELESGDVVTIEVNGRARHHLGQSEFEAEVVDVFMSDIVFKPTEKLQESHETHTWYSDIGYLHGFHKGLERHSDIGKVREVRR